MVLFIAMLVALGYFVWDVRGQTQINVTITTNPDLERGLVAHWTFDGKDMDLGSTTAEVLDRTGNGNTGDMTNF